MTFNKEKWFPPSTKGSRGFSFDADNAYYNALREKVMNDEKVKKQYQLQFQQQQQQQHQKDEEIVRRRSSANTANTINTNDSTRGSGSGDRRVSEVTSTSDMRFGSEGSEIENGHEHGQRKVSKVFGKIFSKRNGKNKDEVIR